MLIFDLVEGTVATLALVVLLAQFPRRWTEPRYKALLAFVACWAVSWPFVMGADAGHGIFGLDSMDARIAETALRMMATLSLATFFAFATRTSSRLYLLAQAIPFAAALVVVLLASMAIPPAMRSVTAALTTGIPNGPVGITSIGVFYTISNIYMGSAFAVALFWAERQRRGSHGTAVVRSWLLVTEIGLASISVATLLVVVADVIRWAGAQPPTMLDMLAITVLLLGLIVFLVGMLVPAAVTGGRSAALWMTHRRDYHRLEPLWSLLNATFPENALEPHTTTGRIPRRVHHRFTRRETEIYDGLYKLSTYVPADTAAAITTGSQHLTAELVREAARKHSTGSEAAPHAVNLIPPGHSAISELRRISSELH